MVMQKIEYVIVAERCGEDTLLNRFAFKLGHVNREFGSTVPYHKASMTPVAEAFSARTKCTEFRRHPPHSIIASW
jgi:hypothetical protein